MSGKCYNGINEIKALGLDNAYMDEKCFAYAKLPATPGYENKVKLGFIAHMDTVADFCDHDIVPVLTENYNGEDLPLGTSGRTLTLTDFPHLADCKGRTLITSDGTTILGVDNKAGIAEIITMLERVIEEKIPHGQISVAFTPDEEVGTGAQSFNLEAFDADYGYMIDGDGEGEIQFENFNAYKAHFDITGVSVHPGSSKDVMINASLVAMEINSMLPSGETPRGTEGYEGFFHLTNMSEIIATCMHLIDNAKKACERANVTPSVLPIRGGTDGCQLSFKGLPCPNLGTGGHGYHGPFEHCTVEGMDMATDVVVELVKLYAE